MEASTTHKPAHELRAQALAILCLADLEEQCRQTRALYATAPSTPLDTSATLLPPAGAPLPGRPPLPRLVPPADVPTRSPFTTEGLGALIHSICHIEYNAIHLALDAMWRFPNMPAQFYLDWLRVADEEAYHFQLLRDHLRGLGFDYGDFDAHAGLWLMCEKTAEDITARMALVPRTLEARGLDATPLIQTKLRKVGTPEALQAIGILDIILRDEVGHVAIGNHWYRWLCDQQGLDPITHYRTLARQHTAPRLKPPFNQTARLQAGFSQQEIDFLTQVV